MERTMEHKNPLREESKKNGQNTPTHTHTHTHTLSHTHRVDIISEDDMLRRKLVMNEKEKIDKDGYKD